MARRYYSFADAELFKHYFDIELADFWEDPGCLGFDIVKFNDFIKCPEGVALYDHITKTYLRAAAQLVVKLLSIKDVGGEEPKLKINTHPKKSYFLREHLATVILPDDTEILISRNLGGGGILFDFPDIMYSISLDAMMQEVLRQRGLPEDDTVNNDTDDDSSDSDSPD